MIAQAFPPYQSSGTARPTFFALTLPEFGYFPVVIAADRLIETDLSPELTAELADRCEIHRLHCKTLRQMLSVGRLSRANRLARTSTLSTGSHGNTNPRKSNFVKRLRLSVTRNIPWIWPVIVRGLKIYFRRRFDIIWATCDPLQSLVAGYRLSQLTGKPLIVDIRDPISYGSEWTRCSPSGREYTLAWETRILRRAARIVFTSPLTMEIMKEKFGPQIGGRMVTITNGYMADSANEPKRDIGSEKCLFLHLGIIAPHRDPETVLRGFKLACETSSAGDDMFFQFVGRVTDYDLEQAIERHGIPGNMECRGPVAYGEAKCYARGADVLVIHQPLDGEGSDIVCGKSFEYLAAQKPILGLVPEDGGDAWLLKTTGVGHVTGAGNPREIAKGFLHYWRLWKRGALANAAHKVDLSRFERHNLTLQLVELMNAVLNEEKSFQ